MNSLKLIGLGLCALALLPACFAAAAAIDLKRALRKASRASPEPRA
jgi:hypothetical protein